MIRYVKPIRVLQFLALALLLFSAACASQPTVAARPQPTRDANYEKTLVQQLAGMNPTAVPVYQQATQAMDSGDQAKSKQLYEQVTMLAPNFSTAYRRLAYIASSANDLAQAEQLARTAVALEPISYNESLLALVLLDKNTPKDDQEAFDLASRAVGSLPDDEQANTALVVAAGATNHVLLIRQADAQLLRVAPANPYGPFFEGLLAAEDGKWEAAEADLQVSQQLGMPAAAVQHALGSGISRNALLSRALRWGGIATVLWLLGFGILLLAGSLLSRMTLQALRLPVAGQTFQVKPQEQRVRSLYRSVISLLSLYYYVSVPFVILTLFVVVGGAFYLFFLIGSIPIQLAFILVVMLFTSVVAILRALFARSRNAAPGRPLRRMDAPELWQFVEEVARKLAVRPVDAIYVTPWVGISVYENGSILEKLRDAGQRNLVLGMGVLPGLTQGQLAAVLAHEYGHFSNRDTAGGDLAHQVYASLHQMAQRLIQGRAAQIFNPVWLFVLGYQRVFLRVTLGASRLQEVLADRFAAMAYGGQNFIDGLSSIIRQGIAFPLQADYEVRRAHDLNRPISNLYDLQAEGTLQGEVEKKLAETMQRATSQYDSHPAPHERIALIESLRIPYSAVSDNQRPALQLFPNPEELQRELTAQLLKNVRR